MNPKTRAKFRCMSVTKREGWDKVTMPLLFDATFSPVSGGSEENRQFFAATPSGSLVLSTIRDDHFDVGKSYYLDFTPAPD